MNSLDSLVQHAKQWGRHARTALVAECSVRVFPVYEEYWVGDYEPAVGRSIENTLKAERIKVAVAEEQAWQNAALARINGWEGVATRDLFDPLGVKPPKWLLDWLARSIR